HPRERIRADDNPRIRYPRSRERDRCRVDSGVGDRDAVCAYPAFRSIGTNVCAITYKDGNTKSVETTHLFREAWSR
ncbi:unnamed protein product, partial [Aphanomyces euteiches]